MLDRRARRGYISCYERPSVTLLLAKQGSPAISVPLVPAETSRTGCPRRLRFLVSGPVIWTLPGVHFDKHGRPHVSNGRKRCISRLLWPFFHIRGCVRILTRLQQPGLLTLADCSPSLSEPNIVGDDANDVPSLGELDRRGLRSVRGRRTRVVHFNAVEGVLL